ncbi:MAG: radical SAM protein [Oscillospiraceae bacterium]|nr:radical SAM protein [Oscillospiraceae bacterium]
MICNLCPRNCGATRDDKKGEGFCKMPKNPVLAKASVHMWEEPPISGTKGSGTIFFSGCSLGCVYCQNEKISHNRYGKEITPDRLREIYDELIAKGVHNINFVNPTHYAHIIAKSLEKPLDVPIVYNCSGYENIETLKMLEGKISVYLPDMKYSDNALAIRYSNAPRYVEISQNAVREMFRQTGKYKLNSNGLIIQGVIIRHLVLPANTKNSIGVIDWLCENFSEDDILFSLMAQYTPFGNLEKFPEINRKITKREYEKVVDYLATKDIDGYVQQRNSASEIYIPEFDLSGVERIF